ncbi:VCBS repeat-containing protein [candidate division WOR-3 bacterium]|nr:VCBS repeat-containing protein [candidate division WOR-3 bacterium]
MKTIVLVFIITVLSVFSISAEALFEEHILFNNLGGAISVKGIDLNEDSFTDIVYSSYLNNHIKWLENDGNQNFTSHSVSENYSHPRAVDVADLDQNGTLDIVSSGQNKISWFSNDGSCNFTENIIDTTWHVVNGVQVIDPFTDLIIDINSDGIIDILATSCSSGVLGWFENDGSGNFTEHIIKDNWTLVSEASPADIDSDGDADIFAAAQASGIWWFENDGNESFTGHLIFNGWVKPNRIQAGDVDGDGDMDFVAGSCGTSAVVGWFENDGNESFTCHPLRTSFGGPRTPIICDIDDDGDYDIFATGWSASLTVFFENDGYQNFSQYIISTDAWDLLDLDIADLDSDGDLDLIGGSAEAASHHLRWWESLNSFCIADFEVDINTGHAPLTVNFTDLSYCKPQALSWAWDFDSDGTIDSNEENPSHSYTVPGTYTVTLIVSNNLETDTFVIEDLISAFDGESALKFSTTLSSVIRDGTPSVNITDSLTIEAWIYPTGWGSNSALGYGTILDKVNYSLVLFKGVYGVHCLGFKLKHEGGQNSLTLTPDSSINLNGWQHVAATYSFSDSTVKIYINGVEQNLTFNPAPTGKIADNSSTNLSIGLLQSNNFRFDGIIDEVRLWNVTRTHQEILDNMSLYLNGTEQGLSGYWKMNEGYGDSIFDCSPNSNNFPLVSVKWVQGTPFYPTGIEESFTPTNPLNGSESLLCARVLNGNFKVSFFQKSNCMVSVSIFDVCGRQVKNIFQGNLCPGLQELIFDMRSFPSGQYFLTLKTDEDFLSTKIALLR